MGSYLTALGTAVPPHALAQEHIADFMCALLELRGEEELRLRKLYRHSGIRNRHSVLADYGRTMGQFQFYPNTVDLEPFPDVSARMESYRRHAPGLAQRAADTCLGKRPALHRDEITDLVTVSCTGMYAPGLDIELVHSLGLPHTTHRYCVNFMGCYAAFNGLKIADALVRANPKAKVLVLCVELCTLHFQKSAQPDHILSNALFADGAAAALVEAEPAPRGTSLSFEGFHTELRPEGSKDMAWEITESGFSMTLSKYVADLLENGIAEMTAGLLGRFGLSAADVEHWAIHPGGPKIVDMCRRQLGLREEDTAAAQRVLAEYGNMSSPTILFVLEELMRVRRPKPGERLAAAAFGPGLTMESALLRVDASP